MRFSLGRDDFGRLECRIGDAQEEHSVYAAEAEAALADLAAALGDLEISERRRGAFGSFPAGQYRWVFRRQGEMVRLAAMFLPQCRRRLPARLLEGEHPAAEALERCRAEIRRFRQRQL